MTGPSDSSSSANPATRLDKPQRRKLRRASVEELLYHDGHEFDFFRAVQILEGLYPQRPPVGVSWGQPAAVRFAANAGSSSFAASPIFEIQPAATELASPKMVVGFMGLTGPAGMLPEHYTDLLRRIELESRGPDKHALRDWFDLFNDRLISNFYGAWRKYRPYANYAGALQGKTDTFTTLLQSVAGLGIPGLMAQCHRFVPQKSDTSTTRASSSPSNAAPDPEEIASSQTTEPTRDVQATGPAAQPTHAAAVERPPLQLALLRYAGLLAQRPRCVANLKSLLEDYFELPFQIQQFHGNWLALDETSQTRLGVRDGNSILGQNAVAGSQTWERQNKILVRVGPLDASQFERFLPGYESEYQENDYSLLVQLIKLYAGPELEFDIRLDVRGETLEPARLQSERNRGLRLGWNSWISETQEQQVFTDSCLGVL